MAMFWNNVDYLLVPIANFNFACSFLTAKVAKKKKRKGRREKTGTENVIKNKTISLTIKVNRQIYLSALKMVINGQIANLCALCLNLCALWYAMRRAYI
jgi:hypothetical protein